MKSRLAAAALAAIISLPVIAADPAPDTVLAKNGEVAVTAGDFLAFIARLKENEQYVYRADVNRVTSAVSSIFVTRTLADEARASGFDKDPMVQRRLRLAQEQVLAQLYMDNFEKSIKVPDFEAHALEVYKADHQRFENPEKYQVQYIIVTTQGRTDAEAKLRADAAREKLASGAPFENVAREYSNDPNFRANQGIYQGQLTLFHPDVAAAARKLPLNQVSPVIHTSDGSYHVIVVKEHSPASVTPFERAKKALIDADEAKYRKEIVDKKLAAITNSKDVVLYTDDIASLATHIDREQLQKLHEDASARPAPAPRKKESGAAVPQTGK